MRLIVRILKDYPYKAAFVFALLSLVLFISSSFSLGLDLWNNDVAGGTPGNETIPPQLPTLTSAEQHFPQALTPADFIHLFRLSSIQKYSHYGQGQTILFLEGGSSFDKKSYLKFINSFSKQDPSLTLNTRIPEIYSNGKAIAPKASNQSAAVETMLDTEWAHVIAPKARLVIVDSSTTSDGQLKNILKSLKVTSISITYVSKTAVPVRLPIFDSIYPSFEQPKFIQWMSEHYATFVSSGDAGSHIPPETAASQAVLVGGIALRSVSSSQLSLSSYIPWSGEGYGTSKWDILTPSFQRKAQRTLTMWRHVPDVVWLAGYPGALSVVEEGWFPAMGTSLSAPCWSALWALASEDREIHHHSRLDGYANQILYNIARTTPSAFKHGSSRTTWTPGWGLGYPNIGPLFAALKNVSIKNHHTSNHTILVLNFPFYTWVAIELSLVAFTIIAAYKTILMDLKKLTKTYKYHKWEWYLFLSFSAALLNFISIPLFDPYWVHMYMNVLTPDRPFVSVFNTNRFVYVLSSLLTVFAIKYLGILVITYLFRGVFLLFSKLIDSLLWMLRWAKGLFNHE